jgi:phospholipase C
MKRFETLFFSAALVALAACGSGTTPAAGPGPSTNAIQHVVIMIQENRSFDNIFAGFPGADTTLVGACKPAPWCKGSHMVKLHSVKLESNGVSYFGRDIDHSHHGFKIECDPTTANVCQNDGFDLISFGQAGQSLPAKLYPYAYVDRKESAPYWKLAKQYTLADEMFFTETASSFIAHQSILSGTVQYSADAVLTDQPNNTPWGCDAPKHGTTTPLLFRDGRYKYNGPFPCFTQYGTMADLLDAKNVSWKFYVDSSGNGPGSDFSGAVWNGYDAIKKIRYGPDWHKNISIPNTTLFSDVKAGTLPSVSWVIPTLFDSDHPAAGCNGGPWWVTKVVNALGTSKYWKNTAIVLLWDDWGGWYDNAPPDQTNYHQLGFRVPMVVISPYAKPANISNTLYDTGSILRFVEQTFGLGSLGTTDATSTSIMDIFDFTQKPNAFSPAPEPPVLSCGKKQSEPGSEKAIIDHDGGVPE